MPFLRLARDQRGYETTILFHLPHSGTRPRVLYWYRSAPGVRVGRPALDEDAIRTIEEQHPDIEFDWPHILEVRAAAIVEVEQRPERRVRGRGSGGDRRRPSAPREAPAGAVVAPDGESDVTEADVSPLVPQLDEPTVGGPDLDLQQPEAEDESPAEPPAHAPELLAELVGRAIATRLRARYAEINARIHELPAADARRAAWQARAEPLNPDSWLTPQEILHGVSRADQLFDALRRDLLGPT